MAADVWVGLDLGTQSVRALAVTTDGTVAGSRLVGGPVATDLSNALKTGAHLIDETWPTDVVDALGVPADVLPPLVRPGTVIGHVSAAAAEETGLPAGTPVVAGATDGCAGQLGAGVLRPGSWNSVLGTTLVLKGVARELVRDVSWHPNAPIIAGEFAQRCLYLASVLLTIM